MDLGASKDLDYTVLYGVSIYFSCFRECCNAEFPNKVNGFG